MLQCLTVLQGKMDDFCPKMNWSAPDLPGTLRLFKQKCELYFAVKQIPEKRQVAHILLFSGEEGLRMYNSWSLPTADKEKTDVVWHRFETHIQPRSNFRVARLIFQQIRQADQENIDDFIGRLKLQAQMCEFRDTDYEERLIEQAIAGLSHSEPQKKLLGKGLDLTFVTLMNICHTHEASLKHMKQLAEIQGAANSQSLTSSVDAFKSKGNQQGPPMIKDCRNCGRSHPRNKCPAYGATCNFCKKLNHYEKVCFAKKRGSSVNQQKINEMTSEVENNPENESHFENLQINTVNADTRDEIFTEITAKVNHKKTCFQIRVKVDTGAQGNTLPIRMLRKMFPELMDSAGMPNRSKIQQRKTVLTAYNNTQIPQFGYIELVCRHTEKNQWTNTGFYIVDDTGPAILGLSSSRTFEIVSIHCAINSELDHNHSDPVKILKQQYPECFDKIGKFQGEYHIELQKEAQPVVHAQRKFPIQLRDKLKQELNRMEDLKIIEKVSEPTDWVNSMVIAHKADGSLRICIDPKDLNRVIRRTYHKTPTLEEITHKLNGAKYFSKLDAKSGYWAVKLDTPSSLLTTFNTPFGRYCYQRMPFGLVMSQDVFQQKMDQILEDCTDFTISIADDVCLFAKTEDEHEEKLQKLMSVARQKGLVFNSPKCDIKQKSVKFFGSIFDENGAHPDPEKVADIRNMKTPSRTAELQSFLGLVTYMAPFIPKLSDLTAPLRSLLKKDTVFDWTSTHDNTFEQIKHAISETTTLAYFDSSKATVIQVDASLQGLGAALIQEGKPIAFASKTLSDTERRYANIERELLAVVFGCERFHTYIYGKPFTVESDHKPLEMISLKNLTAAPPRLQRMILRLQPYDVTIKYLPGKEMLLADGLSRLPAPNNEHTELDVRISLVQFSTERLVNIRQITRTDNIMRALHETITQGWPDTMREIPKLLQPYWPFRDELSIEDGLIVKGTRVIIPEAARKDVLNSIHEGHQGSEKCKLRAKTCVYWPKINKDIENLVANCDICNLMKNQQPRETLQPHEIPTRPWQIIGTDLFALKGAEYLIVADYYSKFPFVRKMPQHCTSQAVINALKQLFGENGTPERIVSDNGPQYDSELFRQFAEKWSFDHITSSPTYPQSNGFIERNIQTVKRTMEKATMSNVDIEKALQNLRATPVDHSLPSPSELLNNRMIRGSLPIRVQNNNPIKDQISDRLIERQQNQKYYFDKHAHDLTPLLPGQHARIQNQQGRWMPATVVEKCAEPRSYIIETPTGSVMRRNRRQILDCPVPAKETKLDQDIFKPAEPVSPAPKPSSPVIRPNPQQDTCQTRLATRVGREIQPRQILDL